MNDASTDGAPSPPPPRRLDYAPRESRPWWVQVGLWGVPSRRATLGWMWLSIIGAVGTGIFVDPLGWLLLGAAAMYFATVWWMDRYGTWKR